MALERSLVANIFKGLKYHAANSCSVWWVSPLWFWALQISSCWSATLLKWSHTLTIANIFQEEVRKYMRELNKLQIIHLTSLAKVTCSVWRSFLCFQIIRIILSQTLPLPRLSHRAPCCLASVPVGDTYTTFCSNVLSTNWLVQFINVKHCHLKWDDFYIFFYILHSDSVLWRRGCSTALWDCNTSYNILDARLLCCNILF